MPSSVHVTVACTIMFVNKRVLYTAVQIFKAARKMQTDRKQACILFPLHDHPNLKGNCLTGFIKNKNKRRGGGGGAGGGSFQQRGGGIAHTEIWQKRPQGSDGKLWRRTDGNSTQRQDRNVYMGKRWNNPDTGAVKNPDRGVVDALNKGVSEWSKFSISHILSMALGQRRKFPTHKLVAIPSTEEVEMPTEKRQKCPQRRGRNAHREVAEMAIEKRQKCPQKSGINTQQRSGRNVHREVVEMSTEKW